MKISLISLGCSKNLVDSEIMLSFLKKAGFELIQDVERSDVAIVNTCAFINDAKKESIDTIFDIVRLKRQKKIKKIIVAGCLPQRYKQELVLLLKEADGFLGTGYINRIGEAVRSCVKGKIPYLVGQPHYRYRLNSRRLILTPKHYAFVRIADGCSNRCSYCVIPDIRGKYNSRPIESIVNEVKYLSDRGVKEINLISQDTTYYGVDRYGQFKLDELLEKVTKIRALKWIRLLYAHPKHFNPRLIKIIADEPKICKYIDLPIQHINDKILKLMHRKVTGCQLKALIEQLRSGIPGVVIRTSVMVGFPQETDTIFKELYNFVRTVQFDRLGVFKYSREEKTVAARLKFKVSDKIKQTRFKKIMLLQQKIIHQKNDSFIGRELEVIIDEPAKNGIALARSQFDAPEVDGVVFVKSKDLKAGEIIRVRIIDNYIYDLVGKKI